MNKMSSLLSSCWSACFRPENIESWVEFVANFSGFYHGKSIRRSNRNPTDWVNVCIGVHDIDILGRHACFTGIGYSVYGANNQHVIFIIKGQIQGKHVWFDKVNLANNTVLNTLTYRVSRIQNDKVHILSTQATGYLQKIG